MRTGFYWLTIGAVTLISVGVHLLSFKAGHKRYDHSSTEMRRKSMVRKVHAYFCPCCEDVYAHDIGMCPECESELETLSFISIGEMQAHFKRIEDAQRERGLATRMPGMRFTRVEAELFAAFEERNHCILYARPSSSLSRDGHAEMQATEQPTVETLPIAEFNVFLQYERKKWNSLPVEDR